MNKLITLLSASFVALTATAADFTYTATPEPGIVPVLNTVEVVFDEFEDVDINTKDDITFTHNGTPLECSKDDTGNAIIVKLNGAQTAPGRYELTFKAGSIMGFVGPMTEDGGYTDMPDLENDITLTYTIEGQSENAFAFTCEPAAGTVAELQDIKLTFTDGWGMMDIANSGDVTLTCDGEPVSANLSIDCPYEAPEVNITLSEKLTAPGTYVLTIPAANLAGISADGENYAETTEPITVEWTIEGAEETLDFAYTADPVSGAVLRNVDKVVLTFPKLDSIDVDKDKVYISLGEGMLELSEYNTTSEGNIVTISLVNPAEPGTVSVYIDNNALTGIKGTTSGKYDDAILLEYTIASPVVYDLDALKINVPKPNAEGEISAEKSLLSVIFVYEEEGLVEGSAANNVTIQEVNGDFTASASLKKGFGLNSKYSYFAADFGKEPVYNGEYVITIEQGAFGDSVWKEDNEIGHSNGKIELRFTLVDGIDRPVEEIKPVSVTPEEGKYDSPSKISTVTLKFAEGIEAVAGAVATMAGDSGAFSVVSSEFVKASDGSYSVSFDNVNAVGVYVFSVAAGMFGDAAFVASNGKEGQGSAPISIRYEITDISGVTTIVAGDETAPSVYNVSGAKISGNVENLPAGLYIVNGKKIIVK